MSYLLINFCILVTTGLVPGCQLPGFRFQVSGWHFPVTCNLQPETAFFMSKVFPGNRNLVTGNFLLPFLTFVHKIKG
ncbi:hypothetical protein A4D02_22310 [Niastella koreensis]|uniref:Uncharacterized protein n=1 Tax=Niastella koreensis TaxID=354356 RepID=A0ABX3P2E6_9BACT|nr:hypothetical protein A4D02_22310 [Niastella koreensis]